MINSSIPGSSSSSSSSSSEEKSVESKKGPCGSIEEESVESKEESKSDGCGCSSEL